MKNTKALLQENKIVFLLPLGFALGLLAVWLFIGLPLGISWPIFTTAALAALALTSRRARLQPERRNLWLWPALLFFAGMVALRANPFLTFLNICATLLLFAFIIYHFAAGQVTELSLAGIVLAPLNAVAQTLANMGPAAAAALEPAAHFRRPKGDLFPVLRGGILALPVIALFSILLASADLVFGAYLQRLVRLDLTAVTPVFGRGLFAASVALVFSGALATAVLRGWRQKQAKDSQTERWSRTFALRFSLGSIETGTILILVSALFTVFMLLQFKYLFGGRANIGREGLTYAEYARRGFFELVLVASLTLALILALNWLTHRESKSQITLFNTLSTTLVVLVLLMLCAAFWRMRLYEQAYGYTELRLTVLVFELWLAILLVWFLITLWRAPERFPLGVLVSGLCFIATLNFINPDALIVRHNLERYRTSGDLDVWYLSTLSLDAVPMLVHLQDEIRDDDQEINDYAYRNDSPTTMGEFLEDDLQRRFKTMNSDPGWREGRAYHHAKYQAYRALACFSSAQAGAVCGPQ